jgi:hypothetical protein
VPGHPGSSILLLAQRPPHRRRWTGIDVQVDLDPASAFDPATAGAQR